MSAKEVLTSNGETFSFSTFHDIQIMIRDKDGTINYTKFYNSIRTDQSKKYDFKEFVRFNHELWKLIQNYINNDALKELQVTGVGLTKTSSELTQITDVLKQKHNITTLNKLGIFNNVDSKYRKEVRGQYGNKELLTFISCNVNVNFYRYINSATSLINDRMIKENEDQKALIERLTKERDEAIQRDINSNKGCDHHRPGSISITPLKQENRYRLRYFQINIDPNDYTESTVLNNIYNVMKMKQHIYYYGSKLNLKFCKHIRGSEFEIYDLEKFKSFINDLQHHKFQINITADEAIEKYVSTHKYTGNRFIGDMFELYVWKTLGYPVFKYTTTEEYSLTKQDYGVDLFDPDIPLLGQCKCYLKSQLTLKSLDNFRNFCKDFSQWRRVLVVNRSIDIDINVKTSKLWKVEYIDDNNFREFLRPYLSEEILDKNVPKREFDYSKIRYKLTKDVVTSIRSFVNEQLQDHDVLLVDMIRLINEKFKVNKPITEAMFYHLCKDIYKVDRSGAVLRNENNEKILILDIDDKEKQFIFDTVGYGEFIKSELIDLHNEQFGTNYTDANYLKKFKGIFKSSRSTRVINGEKVIVLSIYHEDELDIFNSFIDENGMNIEKFNEYFHRYETKTSLNKLLKTEKKVDLPNDNVRKFIEEHITSDGLLCTEAYDLYIKSTTDPCKVTDFNKQMKQLCTKKRVYPSRQWRWLRNSSSK